MAAVEPMDELKECLRASVEMLLDKLNDRLHEDMDGVDYLCINQLKLKKDGTTEVRQETQALALFQVKSTWN